jgi:hypothetical protein
VFALIGALAATQTARAACGAPAYDTPGFSSWTPASLGEAHDCLYEYTRFFDEARSTIDDPNFGTGDPVTGKDYDDLLPTEYELSGRYSDAVVGRVIDAAISAERGDFSDVLLYEASLRRASAHGMFGDDALLRGLDPGFDGDVLDSQWVAEAIRRLDSRSCHDSLGTDVAKPCVSRMDCSGVAGETQCLPSRFSSAIANGVGVHGAVQEYRRAEQAILRAIETLGIERFQEIDDTPPLCLGSGCAARLLLRLSAMKSRAQAEHADLLWRRATAASGVPTEVLTCSAGDVGAVCGIHRDCDLPEIPGECGPDAPSIGPSEAAGILMRGVVREALAEAAASESLLSRLLATAESYESVDWASRSSALDRLGEIESRSLNGITPFGIPADYVPILTSVQQGSLDCLQNCGTGCDQATAAQCMIELAQGSEFLDLLGDAETAESSAQMLAAEAANLSRQRALHVAQMESAYEDKVVEMLGEACAPGACTCTPDDEVAGLCLRFEKQSETKIWLVEGATCDEASPACGFDSGNVPDGDIERQVLAIRASELARHETLVRIRQNQEQLDEIIQKFATIGEIQATECEDSEVVISRSGAQLSSAIAEKNKALEGSAAEFALGMLGTFVSGSDVLPLRKLGIEGTGFFSVPTNVSGVGFAKGAMSALRFGLAQRSEKRRQEALAKFEKRRARIQLEKDLAMLSIRCRTDQQMLQLSEDDAIAKVVREAELLALDVEQQSLAILDAMAGAARLAGELELARTRYDEALEIDAIWNAPGFRNPANFRAIALEKRLAGRSAFRVAQVLTWMLMRAVAYDLARPDAALIHTFDPSDVLQIGSCQSPVCSGDASMPCSADFECQALGKGLCTGSSPSQIADSEGSCSMQAVFAARTVEDLRSLIRSAVLELALPGRSLACPNDQCEKQIRLRDIYTDKTLGASRPKLGDVLLERPKVPGRLFSTEFGISLERDFEICSLLPEPDGTLACQPSGVALLGDGTDGMGSTEAANFWNARALEIAGLVHYEVGNDPRSFLCRDPASGRVVNPSASECLDGSFQELSPGAVCGHASPPPGMTGCEIPESQGGGETACKCYRLTTSNTARPRVRLRQLDPGLVRTSAALSFDAGVGPYGKDSQIAFRMRSGALPLSPNDVPDLSPFTVEGPELYEGSLTPVYEPDIKGVPVASSRWELSLGTNILFNGNVHWGDEYVRSIQDIELLLRYQAFDLK